MFLRERIVLVQCEYRLTGRGWEDQRSQERFRPLEPSVSAPSLRALRELSYLLVSLPSQREIDTFGLFAVWFGLISHCTQQTKKSKTLLEGCYRAETVEKSHENKLMIK